MEAVKLPSIQELVDAHARGDDAAVERLHREARAALLDALVEHAERDLDALEAAIAAGEDPEVAARRILG